MLIADQDHQIAATTGDDAMPEKSQAPDAKRGYSRSYTGTTAADMLWLEFVWREVVAELPAAVKGGTPGKSSSRADFVVPFLADAAKGQHAYLELLIPKSLVLEPFFSIVLVVTA